MSNEPRLRILAGPWGLPDPLENRLHAFIEDDDPEAVALLLSDEASEPERDPRLFAVLAHAQIELAEHRVGLEQALPLAGDALGHLQVALARGVDAQALEPLRARIERVLDTASRRELAVLEAVRSAPESASDEVLEDGAYLLERLEPLSAASLFERLAERQGEKGFELRVRAAIARQLAGDDSAAEVLQKARTFDWKKAGLWDGRLITEGAYVALLAEASEAEDQALFQELWSEAIERMDSLGVRFPAVWSNQERLLALCLARREPERARAVARRIRDSRPWVPRALEKRLEQAEEL